jgi:methionyl-tRNA formyltransferase
MNPEFDAGRILAQRPVEPHPAASVFETTALLYRTGADLLASAVVRIITGDKGTVQSGPGTYQSWPTAAETATLRRQGGALLRFKDLILLARARLPR